MTQSLSPPVARFAWDDLNSRLGNWTPIAGSWTIAGAYMHSTTTLTYTSNNWTAQPTTADYIVQALLRANSSSATARLIGRWIDNDNHYYLTMFMSGSGAQLRLRKILAGTDTFDLGTVDILADVNQDHCPASDGTGILGCGG